MGDVALRDATIARLEAEVAVLRSQHTKCSALEERARIVAWLRLDEGTKEGRGYRRDAAEHIERGAHLTPVVPH